MSLNTILATAPLTATGYHLKATGTALGQSLIYDNGTNVGIGTAIPDNTLDVIRGTAGTMGRGVYESASFSFNGDMKFGLYTSAAAGLGGASLLFGATNFTAAGSYPGFELQFSPSATLASNYIRFNSVGRDATGTVVSATSNILCIFQSANVVIGSNTDAGYKLDVNGTGRFSGSVTADRVLTANNTSNSTLVAGGIEIQSYSLNNSWIGNNIYYDGTGFKTRSAGYAKQIYFGSGSLDFNVNATSYAAGATTSLITALSILNSGAATFSSSVTSSFGSSGANFNSNAATTGAVNAYRVSNTTGVGSYGVESNAGGDLMTGGLSNATLLQSISNTALQFGTNQVARMTITSGGKVGIGQNSPNYSLTVNGSIQAGYILLGDIANSNNSTIEFVTAPNSTSYFTGAGNINYYGAGDLTLCYGGGNVLIGSITDQGNWKAQVTGNMFIRGSGATSATNGLYMDNSSGTPLLQVKNDGQIVMNNEVFNTNTSGTTRTLFIGNGNYNIGGVSSIRASKTNIENISKVDWLYQLNPVTFNYRKKDSTGNYTENIYDDLNYGLIAEDTAPIADFLINYNNKADGSKEMVGIEYSRLITPMLKAIQEQQLQIKELQTKIQTLENK